MPSIGIGIGIGLSSGAASGVPLLSSTIKSLTHLRLWQTDYGLQLGTTPLASGSSPPAVTVSGQPSSGAAPALRMEIDGAGTLGVATFKYGLANTGSASPWIETNRPTAASYQLQGAASGIIAAFPAGTYAIGHIYQGTCSAFADRIVSASALQATASLQPLILIDAFGRPFLRFDGSNDFLLDSSLNPGTPVSVGGYFNYGAFVQRTWAASRAVWGCGTGQLQLAGSTSTPNLIGFDGTISPVNGGAVLGSKVFAELLYTGTTADTMRLGGVATVGSFTMGNADPSTGFALGCSVAAGTAADCGAFDLYSCGLAFGGAPTASELTALRALGSSLYSGIAI